MGCLPLSSDDRDGEQYLVATQTHRAWHEFCVSVLCQVNYVKEQLPSATAHLAIARVKRSAASSVSATARRSFVRSRAAHAHGQHMSGNARTRVTFCGCKRDLNELALNCRENVSERIHIATCQEKQMKSACPDCTHRELQCCIQNKIESDRMESRVHLLPRVERCQGDARSRQLV
jgi:hypothetical protein